MELAGKVAVVTGASSGIGEATALALARAGARVVAVARREERLAQLAGRAEGITPHAADVTDDGAVAGLAARLADDYGACHVLVNNAGASSSRRFRGPDDLAELRDLMDLNLLGAARCMAHLAPLLFASAPARVVNVASVAGKVGVSAPAYAASKFALVGFSEAVAADWARRQVTVTQLNPGFIATEGFPQTDLMRSPVTRRLVGRPEIVAEAIVSAARKGGHERTVPRWYRAFVVLRHVAPPVFRAGAGRVR